MAAIAYCAERALFRIVEFFRHWYVKSVRIYSDFILNILQRFDRVLALKVSVRYLFHPLYGDYSIVGYIFGFVFRLLRSAVALVIYAAIICVAALFYLFWVMLPPYLLLRPIL